MLKRFGTAWLFLSLAFGLVAQPAWAQSKDSPDTPKANVKAKVKAKVEEKAKADDVNITGKFPTIVKGELLSLDIAKLKAEVKTESGNKTVVLDKDIEVQGQRGGKSRDGLEDERLDPGAKVEILTQPKAKTASLLIIREAAPKAKPVAKAAEKADAKTAVKADAKKAVKAAKAAKTVEAAASKTAAKEMASGPGGKIVKVDLSGMKFTVADDKGKVSEYKFNADTQFIGPRGGLSDKKEKDDRFTGGAPVKLTLKDGKGNVVTEVRLPFRSAISQ